MITGILIGVIVGFVAGIFVYRNNTIKIAAIADKVDKIYDQAEAKLEK